MKDKEPVKQVLLNVGERVKHALTGNIVTITHVYQGSHSGKQYYIVEGLKKRLFRATEMELIRLPNDQEETK